MLHTPFSARLSPLVALALFASCFDEKESENSFVAKASGLLNFDESVTGMLRTHDAGKPMTRAPYQVYRIAVVAGQKVMVTASSSEMKPTLSLFSPNGVLLAHTPGDQRGRISIGRRTPTTNLYTVNVPSDQSGAYGQSAMKPTRTALGADLYLSVQEQVQFFLRRN